MLDKTDLPNVSAMTNENATKNGDIIVLTVPLQAQMITLRSIKDHVNGKIFVDATVPLEGCIGGKPTRFVDLWEGSAAERSAAFLGKEARLVSAFSNLSAASLNNINHNV